MNSIFIKWKSQTRFSEGLSVYIKFISIIMFSRYVCTTAVILDYVFANVVISDWNIIDMSFYYNFMDKNCFCIVVNELFILYTNYRIVKKRIGATTW
jgi:hypothetical protein